MKPSPMSRINFYLVRMTWRNNGLVEIYRLVISDTKENAESKAEKWHSENYGQVKYLNIQAFEAII